MNAYRISRKYSLGPQRKEEAITVNIGDFDSVGKPINDTIQP